jgi:hypothetical protein
MIQGKCFAWRQNRRWAKIAVAGSLLFAALSLCTALAQTPTITATVTTTTTPSATQTPADTPTFSPTPSLTSTPSVTPTLAITQVLTLTPNASASPTPTVTKTFTTRTRTRTPTPGGASTATQTPLPSNEVVAGYIPVVGSLPGNFGSFFRTSVQVLNPGGSPITGRLVFHPSGASGQSTDPSQSFTLAPEQIVSFPDVGATLGQTGLGSVDVFVGEGQTIPIVIARIFDDSGSGGGGTKGFTEPFVHPSDVPPEGSGFLVGPSDVSQFRFNIGIRTLDDPVTVTATVRDTSGSVLHTVTRSYDANVFVQTSSTNFLGFSLGNDQSIELAFTGGGLIAYGATVDNVSNDPSAQFLPYITATQIAQRARPSRGGSSTPIKLALVLAMLGVGAGIVMAKR